MTATQPSPPNEPVEPERGGGLDLRLLLALVVVAAIAGGAILLIAGKGSSRSQTARVGGVKPPVFSGLEVSPPKAAPPLALRNYDGEPVNVARYRGKAVLVTFIYTHCPDVCPLITANLRVAQALLGPAKASKAQIVAVSVDPRGDTPKTVAGFLAAHDMTGRMRYLIGSLPELARVWKAWGVGSERDAHNPDLVEHSGIIYGISASGNLTTIYAGNFRPAEVVHDIPLLETR